MSEASEEQVPAALPEDSAEPPTGGSTGTRVAKATAGIMVFHLLRFLLGFMEKPLLAHYFGTTFVADAYSVARDIINRTWLIFEKVINPSFLPCFIQALKEDGEERAWRFTSTVAGLMTGLLIATTAIAWFVAPPLVNFYTEHPKPGEIQLTILLLRVMVFGLLFLGLSSLTYVVLNGYKRFALAALGDTLWKGSILASVFFVVPYLMKMHKVPESVAVIALAAGFLVGSFAKLFPQVVGLWHKRHLLRFSLLLDDPILRRMGVLIPPLLVGILVSEYRGMMMVKFAGAAHIGEGGRAALTQYSRTPIDALIQVFPYAMSIGIFPFLAELHISREKQAFTDTFMGALRVCALIFLPLTAGFIAFRYPIVRALYESGSGKFDSHSVELTVSPFVFFSLGMVFFAGEAVVNQTWYATANTLVPNTVGIITSLTSVGFAWVAVKSMGHGLGAIALAETLAKGTKVLILIFLLRGAMGDMRLRQHSAFLLKILLSSVAMVAFGILVFKLSAPVWSSLPYSKLLRLERLACVAFALGGGLVLHLVLSFLLRVEEAQYVLRFLARRVGKRAA